MKKIHDRCLGLLLSICLMGAGPIQAFAAAEEGGAPVTNISENCDKGQIKSPEVKDNSDEVTEGEPAPPTTQEEGSEESCIEDQIKNFEEKTNLYLQDGLRTFDRLEEKEAFFLTLEPQEQYLFLRFYNFFLNAAARTTLEAEDDSSYKENRQEVWEKLTIYLELAGIYRVQKDLKEEDRLQLDGYVRRRIETELDSDLTQDRIKRILDLMELPDEIEEGNPSDAGMYSPSSSDINNVELKFLVPLAKLLFEPLYEGDQEAFLEAFQTYFPIQTQESNNDMYEKEMPEAAEKEIAELEIPKLGAARAAYQVGWNSDSTGWWYAYSTSAYYKDCWQYLSYNGVKDWYYFKSNGYIYTDTWVDANNYVNGSGYCTVASAASFGSIKDAIASGHCQEVRLSPAKLTNSAELKFTKSMKVTTTSGVTCTVYGTGTNRWVVSGGSTLTVEGNVVFHGQQGGTPDVTSNLFVLGNGTLIIQGNVQVTNSVGHGIYGDPYSNIQVKAGAIHDNPQYGIGTYGTVTVSGGEFYKNDSGVYVAGTFNGSKTGGKATITGGKMWENNYGIASSDYALFQILGGTVEKNKRYGILLYPNCTAALGGTLQVNSNHCGVYNMGTTEYKGGIVQGSSSAGILNEGNLTMSGGTICENKASTGAGIQNKKTLVLSGGEIKHNMATGSGGGIYNSGTLTGNGGTIAENQAVNGGGLYNAGNTTFTNGNIQGNKVTGQGGGCYNAGTLIMKGGSICDNTADGNGGGICNLNSFTLEEGRITGNYAVYGGGIQNTKTVIMKKGSIAENHVSIGGAGVNNDGTFTMSAGELCKNEADADGGGIRCWGTSASTQMTGGSVYENWAGESGGGISIRSGAACATSACVVKNNEAVNGKAIYVDGTYQVFAEPEINGDVFLAPTRFILVTGNIIEFCCSMGENDIFDGRILAQYSLTPEKDELHRYDLEEFTAGKAKEKLLEIEGGKTEEGAYPYSVYLNASLCRINYHSNQTDDDVKTELVSLKERYTLKTCPFTYENHTFVGWDFKGNSMSGEEVFHDGDTILPEELLMSGDILLKQRKLKDPLSNSILISAENPEISKELDFYAIWDNPPGIKSSANEFYEGEKVTKEQMMQGILEGTDLEDGTITENIRITGISYEGCQAGYQGKEQSFSVGMPKDFLLDTYKDKGMVPEEKLTHRITYYLQDSAGNETSQEAKIYVRYNEYPQIDAPEVHVYTVEEIKREPLTEKKLCSQVQVSDIEDDMARTLGYTDEAGNLIDIKNSLKINRIEKDGQTCTPEKIQEAGEYQVTYEVDDRFGKNTSKPIPLRIMNETDYMDSTCTIRFISLEQLDTLAEDGLWNKEEIKGILEQARGGQVVKLSYEDIKKIKEKREDYKNKFKKP